MYYIMFLFTSQTNFMCIMDDIMFINTSKNHTVVPIYTVTGSKKMIILELRFCHVVYKTYIQILLFITNSKSQTLNVLGIVLIV